MSKLKFGPIATEKPAKVTVELPAALYRDAEAFGREHGQAIAAPKTLIVPMLERFISSDRGFSKIRTMASKGSAPR